jgi:hypothetical protein
MARKMKKFSAGGAQGRYDRRMADIEKDFKKDSAGKSGKALEVLEAKRAQRTADAKDDLAKRTGADRTATRAAERAAESNLTKTRKYGAPQMVSKFEEPTAKVTDTLSATATTKPQSFGAAFKEARSRLGAGKTFTFNGKSYTTNIAGEGRKPAQRAATPVKAASTPVKAAATTATTPKVDNRFFSSPGANTASTARPDFVSRSPQAEAAIAKAKKDKEAKAAKEKADKAKAAKAAKEAANRPIRSAYEALGTKPVKLAKGGKVKKEKTMKYAKGGSTSSKPPQPTAADRKADAKFRKSVKDLKVTPENAAAIGRGNRSTGMAKGGKIAPKFGAAMKKKSADTKGRAMVKKAGGGKCYASGGLVAGHKSADGIAKKGKTKGKMPTMKKGGYC